VDILKTIILGIVQGLTEFLPISSSGHLALLGGFLGFEEGTLMATTMHAGTLLALIVYFRQDISCIVLSPFKKDMKYLKLLWFLILGSIPAAIFGVLLLHHIESMFDSPLIIGICLIFTGIILFISGFMRRQRDNIRFLDVILIGVGQAIAILPGVSRSGTTISTGTFLGLGRTVSANFSFLLAIPAILGATVLEVSSVESSSITFSLLVGTLVSFLSSLFAIRFLLGFLKKATLRPFSYYCFALGVLSILIGL
jgi:undecaprenyl-diphosphatase